MGNKIQRIYVGSNQVRPPTVTETYNVSNVANNTQYATIYKSGYTIQSVTISTTGACGDVWANYDITVRDNSSNKTNLFGTWSWVGKNESSTGKTYRITTFLNGTEHIVWDSSKLGLATTTVSITWTINRDGTYSVNYNGNIKTGTLDANGIQAVANAFNSSTSCVCFRTNNSAASLTNNTATVIYS